ncbi:MAG: peptidyl-prolyl cis-trans isomerase, partial [Bacteroidetes bacterium]|nr:peptidyl-prolyl cis-trans isomerase [Bacteroidota bacterium]
MKCVKACLLLLLTTNLFVKAAPVDDDVLFTFAGEKVYKSEFLYIYDKNNVGKSAVYSESSIKEYLELYINFKLKVKEAEEVGLDTLVALNEELASYRDQLAKSYLVDKKINERILTEAYERMKQEIRARHILIAVNIDAPPEDTLKAHQKINDIAKRLKKGEDFEKIAKEESNDPSAKDNGGDLGYFTALQMRYPFENKAYTTAIGQVSDPVRTKFGYHIIKIEDKRPSKGQIHVAHIFMKLSKNATEEQNDQVKKRIDDIYKRLGENEEFEQLAKKYSEDKTNSSRGGELAWFGTGRMVKSFEEVAFGLEKDGDFSEPVETEFGWHIIKRLEHKGLPAFEDMKEELRRKTVKDSRSEVSKKLFLEKIKKEYGFKEYRKNLDKLLDIVDNSLVTSNWDPSKAKGMSKPLFILADNKYSQEDFANYINNNQKNRLKGNHTIRFYSLYRKYLEHSLMKYEESNLENKYPEFKSLISEYRDGILLFELTDQKVWSKAVKDSAGLAEFYKGHTTKYMWHERLRGTVFWCADEATANKAKKLLENKSNYETLKGINTDDKPNLIRIEEDGTFEKEQNIVVDQI